MNKKTIIIRSIIAFILILVMLPAFSMRVRNEGKNKNVIMALNYNSAAIVLSKTELDKTLNANKKAGVTAAVVAEESINSLVSEGYITAIKYNVLKHKYDDESEDIIKLLNTDRHIQNDSYVLITKREDCKQYLKKWIPAKFSSKEYTSVKTPLGADVYVLYNGSLETWKIATGFNESKIENAAKKGFDVVLSLMAGCYQETKYIDYLEEIIKKYDIKYINLKESKIKIEDKAASKKNVNKFCRLIKDNNLTLILTENQDHLSNQKPEGYASFIKSAGRKVIRGYETLTKDAGDTTDYTFRYFQILNSVIDRNIKFVNISQLANGTDTFSKKAERTVLSSKMLINKLKDFGYTIGKEPSPILNYEPQRKLVSAASMLLMILMWLTLIELLLGKVKWLEILALAGAALSVLFTFVAPEAIILLYPTLFAVTAPCFCGGIVIYMLYSMKQKLSTAKLLFISLLLTLVSLLLCGIVQASILSGLDYHLNTLVFRGIKLSLIVPIIFCTAFLSYLFIKEENASLLQKTKEIMNAQIKVYWVLIFAAIATVGFIYILRSGHVSTISEAESIFRNTITEFMQARPRTKEFLIGWPCLTLFVYYIKNVNSKLMQIFLAMGSSILFASVINSFCHVFTDAAIIFSRVFNGLFIGVFVSLAAYVLNILLLKIIQRIK